MPKRSTGAIYLRPVCNAQMMWHFLSLTMGWKLKKRKWTLLPMPRRVIERVHVLAHRDHHGLQFSNRNQKPISAEDADEENKMYVPIDSNKDTENLYDYSDAEPDTFAAALPDPPCPDHTYTNDEGNNTTLPDNASTGVHPKDKPDKPDDNPGVEGTGAANIGVMCHYDG